MHGKLLHPSKTDRRTFLKLASASAGGIVLLNSIPFAVGETTFPDLERLRHAHRQAGLVSPGRTYRAMEWEFHTPPQQTFDINLEGAIGGRPRCGCGKPDVLHARSLGICLLSQQLGDRVTLI